MVEGFHCSLLRINENWKVQWVRPSLPGGQILWVGGNQPNQSVSIWQHGYESINYKLANCTFNKSETLSSPSKQINKIHFNTINGLSHLVKINYNLKHGFVGELVLSIGKKRLGTTARLHLSLNLKTQVMFRNKLLQRFLPSEDSDAICQYGVLIWYHGAQNILV